MILCVGPTPALQRVMVLPKLLLGEVNRATTTLDGIAGKSVNVAKALQALGETPVATGFLGGTSGALLAEALNAREIQHEFVSVLNPTRQCITVVDQGGGTQTELVEESLPVTEADYVALLEIVRRLIVGCRAAVMSGTLAPGGQNGFYAACTLLAKEAGALTVVDASGEPLLKALAAGPNLVKPNEQELAATTGLPVKDLESRKRAMRCLAELGSTWVVVTAGKHPTLAFDGQTFWRITNPSVLTKNPIGSGDCFTAGLISGLLRGDDLGEACRLGSAAGAANALSLMPGDFERLEAERLLPLVEVEKIE